MPLKDMSRKMSKSNFPQKNNHQVAVSQQSYSGPLPPPAAMAKYEEICPGSAERILKMAELQSEHRKHLECKVIEAQIKISQTGQIFALIIAVSCLISAVICAWCNQPWPASVLGGVTLVGSITAFITGKKQKDSNFAQKP